MAIFRLKKLRNFVENRLPARWVIRAQFQKVHGYSPNFEAPATFSEKIQYRKLKEDHSRFPELADKVLVKNFVARKIGDHFITPTLWSGPVLPPMVERNWPLPFVIKANHGSGMNFFVRTPSDLDWGLIEATCKKWLKKSWPVRFHEPWYNKIERQLLVEPLLEDNGKIPYDYKVFVFNGRAELIQVDVDRFGHHARSIYDRDWCLQPFTLAHPAHKEVLPSPRHLPQILDLAERLSGDFDLVRVDFYDFEDGPRFGEITFTPGNGMERLEPQSYDLKLGNLWKITR